MRASKPALIVSAAAYTRVDVAETDAVACHAVNVIAAAVMADEAARCVAAIIHYSTDYVFDGTALEHIAKARPQRASTFTGRPSSRASTVKWLRLSEQLMPVG